MSKRCSRCQRFLAVTEFASDASRGDKLDACCRACKKKRAEGYAPKRRRYSDDIEKSREHHRKMRYGLDPIAAAELLAKQGNACAICRTPFPTDRLPTRGEQHVDHDHDTGVVRGFLCGRCNTGIGLFDEDPVRLSGAIGYLSPTESHIDHEHF